MFKIATWNVNSLRVRLPHVLAWLASHQPDVLALQETKLPDADFPLEEIHQAGYRVTFSGQKSYNGMAILSRQSGSDIITDIPELQDPQRRLLAMTVSDIRILNIYIPNGESIDSEKYYYKLNWLKYFNLFLQSELKAHSKLIILGDFNIAPQDIDVHDPIEWVGKVLCSPKERAAFHEIIQLGLQDCFRLHSPQEKLFSWWDYRLNAFKRNRGLRIDHILASVGFAAECTRCYIDKTPRALDRPSDHTPVVAEFEGML